MPSIFSTVQENVRSIRAVLECEAITISSHAASPITHIQLRSAIPSASTSTKPVNPATPVPRDGLSFDIAGECLSQDIVDDVLTQGAWITCVRHLRGQELVEAQPSIRLAITAALSRKECERTAGVIKAAVANVLVKQK